MRKGRGQPPIDKQQPSAKETPEEAAHRVFAAALTKTGQQSLDARQILAALKADGHRVTAGFISGMMMGECVVQHACTVYGSDFFPVCSV